MQDERNGLKMESLIKSQVELKDLDHSQPVLIEKSGSVFRTELEGVAKQPSQEDVVSHVKKPGLLSKTEEV